MDLQAARHFVDREDELNLVRQSIGDPKKEFEPQDSSIKECTTNFFGVPGIGKSALLAEIYRQYYQNALLITIAIDILKLRGSANEQINLHEAKTYFIRSVARGIKPDTNSKDAELIQSLQNLSVGSDGKATDQAMNAIVSALIRFEKRVFLFIDSWEYAPEAMLAWVERMLLLPLVREERLVCFMGSQVALRWRQFEVRRRVLAYELRPLEMKHTKEQVGCEDELNHLIFDVTAGLPLANEIVHKYLDDHQPVSLEWLTANRARLANQITNDIQDRVLAGTPDEIKPVFRVLSIFREFDVHTLQVILPQFLDDFKNRSQSSLLLAIKQMVATRLVSWDDTLRAYQIDPTIRKIFARAFEWSDEQRYQAVREAALKYYDDLIKEVPSNRPIYIREYFYHLLYKAPAEDYNAVKYQNLVEQLVRDYFISRDGSYADTQSLAQLKDLIKDDKELPQVLEIHHLPKILLSEALDRVISSIQPVS